MTPPEELYSAPWKTTSFGDPKFVWFNTLNASARNCKFNPSLILTLFNSEVSNVNRPGPRKEPRPTFPKVPCSGSIKALGSYHWSGVPTIAFPLKSGFQLGTSDWLASPVPEILEPASGVKGNPLAARTLPFHCQPPISLSTAPVAPLPKRCPFPNGN